MKYLLLVVSLCLITFSASCAKENISFEERDKILDKAFVDLESSDESTVIRGLETIKKYPTHKGLNRVIQLWEKNISEKVEKEILDTLKRDEVFKKDPSFIEDVFNRNYKVNASKENKLKLKRLLHYTDVKIKKKLIDRIDEDLKAAGGSP
jgi:hypothetical protein